MEEGFKMETQMEEFKGTLKEFGVARFFPDTVALILTNNFSQLKGKKRVKLDFLLNQLEL